MNTISVMIVGVGGQGTLLASRLLGNAVISEGYDVKVSEVHGMSQRGGDVQSNLRLSSKPIASDLIPLGSADLIVSLEPMEALRYMPWLSKNGWIVTSTLPFVNIPNYPEMGEVTAELERHPNLVAFDMDEVAKEVATARCSNMVLLGAAAPFIELEAEKIEEGIRSVFSAKGDKIVDMNITAFRAGLKLTRELLSKR